MSIRTASVFLLALMISFAMPSAFADEVADTEAPDAPTDLSATAVSDSEINLSWVPSESIDLDGYNIYRSLSEEFDYAEEYMSVYESEIAFMDAGLDENTTYYYVVRAFDNSSNEENNTNVVFAVTDASGSDDADDGSDDGSDDAGDDDEDDEDDEDDDGDDVDEETENETLAMTDPYGAEMRLLQLERAIERNIERGEEIIESAEDAGRDTSGLEVILAELEALKTEVQEADPDADNAVEVFVDLKHDAINLSKEFRDLAREIFSESEANAIRNRVRQMEHKVNKALDDQIKEKQRLHNAEMLKKSLSKLGFGNSTEFADAIANGEMTMDEARDQIREHVVNMTSSELKNAYSSVKKQNAAAAVKAKAMIEEIQANSLEREEARIQSRLEKVEMKGNGTKYADAFEKYAEKRLEVIENRQQMIEERAEAREEKIEQMWDKVDRMKEPSGARGAAGGDDDE